MTATSLFYYNDQWGKVDPRVLRLEYKITAAGPVIKPVVQNSASLVTIAALTQDEIDDFLGTEDEFTAAQFDTTSMGADAMGVLVNMNGQAAAMTGMIAHCFSGAGGSTLVTRQSQALGLTDSTLETACALGAYGNMAVKINWGNTPDFDGLTSGTIYVDLHWIAK